MAGMFPTFISHPDDANRRYSAQAGEEWPRNLQIGFYLICTASVIMLLTGMLLFSEGAPQMGDVAAQQKATMNWRTVTFGNIILGVLLVSAAAYFRQGNKVARRFAAGFTAAALFLNLTAFLVHLVTAWTAVLVAVLLAFAMLFAFRPDSNAFVDKMSPRF